MDCSQGSFGKKEKKEKRKSLSTSPHLRSVRSVSKRFQDSNWVVLGKSSSFPLTRQLSPFSIWLSRKYRYGS